MATLAQPETIVLNLQSNIDKAAEAATGALGRLERQIMREGNSLARLETQLKAAKVGLSVLAAGAQDKRAIAAFERQSALLTTMQQKFAAGKVSAEALAAAQSKLESLKGSAAARSTDIGAYKKQESLIASLTDKIGAQKDKIGALHEKQVAGIKSATAMSTASEYMAGKLAASSGAAGRLSQTLSSMGPIGFAAAVGLAVVVAGIIGFVAIAHKAIESCDHLRDQFLRLQASTVNSANGFSWLFNKTHESRLEAEAMTNSINRVAAGSSLGGDKLNDYAVQIRQANIHGKNFETVLKAMSTAGVGGFDQRAKDVLAYSRQLQYMGLSVDVIAKRIEQKLGGTAKQATLSLSVQLMKLREGISWIFSGGDFEPFLRGLNSILSLFYRGTGSATSMRDAVTKFVNGAILLFLKFELKMIQTYIWLVKHRSVLALLGVVVAGVAVLFAALAAIVVVAAVSIGLVAAAFFLLNGAPFVALYLLHKHWNRIWISIKDSTHRLGANLINGLVAGIKSKGTAIWDALKSVTHGALNLLEKLLEIASPSKLMFRMGVHLPAGMAGGIQHGGRQVNVASQRMAIGAFTGVHAGIQMGAAMPSPMRQPTPMAHSGGEGKSVTFSNCTFGEGTSENMIRRWVLNALEGESFEAAVA